jgi:hypothetical protein
VDAAEVLGDADVDDLCRWGDSMRKRDVSGHHNGLGICSRISNRLILMCIRPRLNFAQQQMGRGFMQENGIHSDRSPGASDGYFQPHQSEASLGECRRIHVATCYEPDQGIHGA